MRLSDFKTCELVEELRRREGVKCQIVKPEKGYNVSAETDGLFCEIGFTGEGPAVLFVIED